MPSIQRLNAITAVLVLALALAGCGGGGDEARSTFVDAAVQSSQLTEEQAGCIYDNVSDDLDADQIAGIDLASEPDDIDVATAMIAGAEACLDG